MRTLLLLIVLLVLGSLEKVEAQVPRNIVGAGGECDLAFAGCQPIPLTLSVLCTAGCPKMSAPSLIDINRFWGFNASGVDCVTSTNGGATWVGCGSQPGGAGQKQNYAGAADGSVIAIGRVGTECRVHRSIDNGVIWTRVFTSTVGSGEACGGGATLGGFMLTCLSTGECIFPYVNVSSTTCDVLRSLNNGINWAFTLAGPLTVCDIVPVVGIYNGSAGVVSPRNTNGISTLGFFTVSGAAGYEKSAVWPALNNCWGAVLVNGLPSAICYSSGLLSYSLRSMTGALLQTLGLTNVLAAVDSGGVGVSWSPSVLYVAATMGNVAPPRPIGFWVSRNSGTSFGFVGQTGISPAGMVGGSMYVANGCIYLSAGTTSLFAKIC